MARFYVNCALFEETIQPHVRVSWQYYDKNFSDVDIPVLVVKAIHGMRSCCLQLRRADKFYISKFYKYLSNSRESKFFKNYTLHDRTPIIFISYNYRKKLNININTSVKNNIQFRNNFNDIDFVPPANLLMYFIYLFRACWNYSELYSFLMFLLSISSILSFMTSFFKIECLSFAMLGCVIIFFTSLATPKFAKSIGIDFKSIFIFFILGNIFVLFSSSIICCSICEFLICESDTFILPFI